MSINKINNTASQLDIQNIRLSGNTISSTDTNGDITFAPNGTGAVLGVAYDWLLSGTGSGASVEVLLPQSYDTYFIKLSNYVNSTTAGHLLMTLSDDAGSSYLTTTYQGFLNYNTFNSSTRTNYNSSASFPVLYWSSATVQGDSTIFISNGSATANLAVTCQCFQFSIGAYGGGNVTTSSFVANGFKLTPAAGSITSISYAVYGLNT